MLRRLSYCLLLCCVFLPTRPSRADTLTLVNSLNDTLQFSLPASPTNLFDVEEGGYFITAPVIDGIGSISLGFGSAAFPAQLFLIFSSGDLFLSGPVLYTGDETSPTLIEGSFTLTDLKTGMYTLTIAPDGTPASVTPEPPSIVLLSTALLLASALVMLRRRSAMAVPRM